MALRVTVWNEYLHEKDDPRVKAIYPEGMHVTLKGVVERLVPGAVVRMATQEEPEHGLTEAVLEQTDVLTWWGHRAHEQVSDAVVERVQRRVLQGMGVVFLHSSHFAKPFLKLMGTGCRLQWRAVGEMERLFVVDPSHPIADGLPNHFEIPHEEMYGEFFDIPTPDELVMISWFQGGNVFRSCCTWKRGKGKVVYFRPGHETYPTYHQAEVQRVIGNAVAWAACRSSQAYAVRATKEAVPLSAIPGV
jgi:trehalose utilization protein